MKVKVLFFARSREIVGEREIIFETKGSKVSDVINELIKRHPALGNMKFSVALNRRFVRGDEMVREGDELAIIPPVSGG